MTPSTRGLVAKLQAAVDAGPTPGPWQVIVDEHPHHYGGKHIERRIFTTWDHPQLKGPDGVVNGSVGVGESKGGKPYHFVSIGEKDAAFIATANPTAIRTLLDAIREQEAEVEALRGALESVAAICDETRTARDLQPRMTEIRGISRAALNAKD